MSDGVTAYSELQDFAEVRMGYSFRSRLDVDPAGSIAVVQMKDIDGVAVHWGQADRIALPDFKESYLLQEGDLLFRSRGRSNRAALVDRPPGLAIPAAPLLLIRPYEELLPLYLLWFLNASPTQDRLGSLARGTSVQMIPAESLRTLSLPVPSLDRQRGIAEAGLLARKEQELIDRIAVRRRLTSDETLMKCAEGRR